MNKRVRSQGKKDKAAAVQKIMGQDIADQRTHTCSNVCVLDFILFKTGGKHFLFSTETNEHKRPIEMNEFAVLLLLLLL